MPALAVLGFLVRSGNWANDEADQITAATKKQQNIEIWRILLLNILIFLPGGPVKPPEFRVS
jgi:hypothetical protein